ncbi:hypothetical protein [Candidatus Protochlamydia sp. W-9]|nr:hypothetical protein [Candidatus Protochlamydia sp. W-9]
MILFKKKASEVDRQLSEKSTMCFPISSALYVNGKLPFNPAVLTSPG